jgi:outer membrane protein assembly factor BamB
MFELLDSEEKIGGYVLSEKYFVFTKSSSDSRFKIFVKNISGSTIFTSNEEKVNRFHLVDDFLIYCSRNEDFTRIVNLKTFEVKNINQILYNLLPKSINIFENIYYSTNGSKDNLVYDLKTGKVISKLVLDGDLQLNEKSFLLTKSNNNLTKYLKPTFEKSWSIELGNEINYIDCDRKEKAGEIKKVYYWENKILVLTKCYLICLDSDGNIQFKIRFPDLLRAQTLVIHENNGFIYNYHDYVIIDLQKGELIFHKEIKSFKYEGKEFNNFAQDLTYHAGLLFHSVNSQGFSFILAIKPETGETKWIKRVTNKHINSIRFHKDKMYILDGDGTLYIHEKK